MEIRSTETSTPARAAQGQSLRSARTRAALIDAGLQLLAQRPVDAIAIDELVATAGVAKGSFFNHFADKTAFGSAVADTIRAEIEALVDRFNHSVEGPLDRLSGGMIVGAGFALREPQRATILARGSGNHVLDDHPLNRGVVADMRAAVGAGLVGPGADRAGVLFWLGCCQALMNAIVVNDGDQACGLVADMVQMGLRGLGVPAQQIDRLVEPNAIRIRLAAALASAQQ